MDKLEMVMQMVVAEVRRVGITSIDDDKIVDAWNMADKMQTEADKRVNMERPDVLKASNPMELEWQPDWSQAPSWANWWAMDGFSKKANWYTDKPYLDDDSEVELEWNIDLKINTETYMCAPSFNYQGNWQDSLRKRPQ